MNFFRGTRTRRFVALCAMSATCVFPLVARAQNAPGAGGYNSEFGTDYRVGMAERKLARAPIFVIGMRARTTRAAQQKWVAPRFADALSRRLASVLGASATAPQIALSLSQHGLRPENIGVVAFENAAKNGASAKSSLPLRQTLFALSREYSQRNAKTATQKSRAPIANQNTSAPLLALGGDITLSGPLQNASTQITVSLRVARFHVAQTSAARNGAPRFATRLEPLSSITLRAPSRDWAQLPARCALALSDALPFSLSSSQRSALLRSASPLSPAASLARLRYEARVGKAVSRAMNAQLLWAQAGRPSAASRAAQLQNAATLARQAQSALQVLAVAPTLPQHDRASGNEAAQSAREWLTSMEEIVRAASTRVPRR